VKARYFYGYNIVAASFVIQGVSIGALFTYRMVFLVLFVLTMIGLVLITRLRPIGAGQRHENR
jgi:predicted MFS family arabinose efflux permease